MSIGDASMQVVDVPQPYQPRHVEHLTTVRQQGWRLKVYGISTGGDGPRPELVQAALETAEGALPDSTGPADGRGLGFLVVHDAPALSYVLVCWWAERNEIHQRVFSAPADRPAELAPHGSDAVGCVWELSVVDFERRAWITDVLANPGGPDVEGYLSRTFAADV